MTESQYQKPIQEMQSRGLESLGLMSSWSWLDDPKRLGFVLSRYKFVAKMLDGINRVLEIGCGDGFATRVVRQAVKEVVAIDFDPAFIQDAKSRISSRWPVEFRLHNILEKPVSGKFDAAFCLDVLEHIDPKEESTFIKNIVSSITPNGVFIVGMPSLQSQQYASKQSKEGHINCQDQAELRAKMSNYFHNVFMFSMNDEVVHTGFGQMAQYLFALCCHRK